MTKFLTVTSGAALVGAGLIGYFAKSGVQNAILAEVGERSAALVRPLAKGPEMTAAFQSGEERKFLPLLLKMQSVTGAAGVGAFNQLGKVLAHTNVSKTGRLWDDPLLREGIRSDKIVRRVLMENDPPVLVLTVPVWRHVLSGSEEELLGARERLGTIRLSLDISRALRVAWRESRRASLIIISISLVALLALMLFARKFLAPIARLSSAVDQVAHGGLGEMVSAESHDELGDLARSFNRMSQALKVTSVSRNYLDGVLENVADMLIVTDLLGNMEKINSAAVSTLGYEAAELLHQPIGVLFAEFDKNATLEHLSAGETVKNLEMQMVRKDGTVLPVLYSMSALVGRDNKPVAIVSLAKDMTEQKRAESSLRASEEKFRRLVENLRQNYFFYRHDTGGVMTYLSPSITQVLGYDPEMFLTHYSEYLTDNPINREVERHTNLSIQGIQQPAYLVEIYHKDRSVHLLEVTETPVFGPDGRVAAVEGIANDVTARHLAENRLKALNDCFLNFGADHVKNIQSLTVLCGNLLVSDGAFYQRLDKGSLCLVSGWKTPPDMPSEGKAEGRICASVIRENADEPVILTDLPHTPYAESDPAVRKYELKTYLGRAVKCRGESIGSLCVVYRHDVRPTEEDRKFIGILASAIGVEEDRRAAEELVRQARDFYLTLFEEFPTFIWRCGVDGKCNYFNKTFLTFTGRTAEREMGEGWAEGFHPDDFAKCQNAFSEAFKKREPFEMEYRLRRHDGVYRWVLDAGRPFYDMDKKFAGYIGSCLDITDRKNMEAGLAQKEKLAAVGQLAAGVAHEINNPLGVILGFAQGVVRRLAAGDKLELPLRSIEREALRCKNLVQDLLTFSRVHEPDRGPIELNQAVEGALHLIEARARISRVEVEKQLTEKIPAILGNKVQIQQIIINLANNAIDAMPDGGKLTIATELAEEGIHSWVCLKVGDTGNGVPSELRQHIFEPFFTTKPVGQGTGLGLSLVHEIVRRHSGSIDLQSRPGETTFTIKFPVRTGREPERVFAATLEKSKDGSVRG